MTNITNEEFYETNRHIINEILKEFVENISIYKLNRFSKKILNHPSILYMTKCHTMPLIYDNNSKISDEINDIVSVCLTGMIVPINQYGIDFKNLYDTRLAKI